MRSSIPAMLPGPLLAATIHWGSIGPPLATTIRWARSGRCWSRRWLSWAAPARDTAAADAAAKFAVLGGLAVLIMAAWLIAGASVAARLRDPRPARVVNIALAAALVGTTVLAVLR